MSDNICVVITSSDRRVIKTALQYARRTVTEKFMRDTKNPRIEVGYKDSGYFHQFYLRDNGIGIDPKHHRKIFEKFHRLKEIEDEEGTGLGLAIVDRIVNKHGGRA